MRNVSAEEDDAAMPDYRYELRRGDEVIATGHLTRQQPLAVGDWISIAGRTGAVRGIEPLLGITSCVSWCSSLATSSAAEKRTRRQSDPPAAARPRMPDEALARSTIDAVRFACPWFTDRSRHTAAADLLLTLNVNRGRAMR